MKGHKFNLKFTAMKKMKENKTHTKPSHNVETPEPPQVKDPSEHPSKQYAKREKQSGEKSSKHDKSGGEVLTPNEEL
jgi:hypothetical protein